MERPKNEKAVECEEKLITIVDVKYNVKKRTNSGILTILRHFF
jgi:hypothetical protein